MRSPLFTPALHFAGPMTSDAQTTVSPVRASVIRSVALPIEHGGWAFLLEPIVLGLLVAWSWTGLVLSIGALAAFLLHQPLKTAVRDRMARRRAPRTIWAERFAASYAVIAIACLGWVVWSAPSRVVVALGIFVPLAAVQLAYDLRGQSRALVPEIAGAAALAGIAVAIAMLDGWTVGPAIGLWGVLVARSAPSIVYVRERLLLERGKSARVAATICVQAIAILAVLWLWWAGVSSPAAVVATVVLLGRAWHGLSRWRVGRRPAMVGMQESFIGLGFVIAVWLGR